MKYENCEVVCFESTISKKTAQVKNVVIENVVLKNERERIVKIESCLNRINDLISELKKRSQ